MIIDAATIIIIYCRLLKGNVTKLSYNIRPQEVALLLDERLLDQGEECYMARKNQTLL